MARQIIRDVLPKGGNPQPAMKPRPKPAEPKSLKSILPIKKEEKPEAGENLKTKIPIFGIERHSQPSWWKSKKLWLSLGGTTLFSVIVFFGGAWFAGAGIEVTPRIDRIEFKAAFSGVKGSSGQSGIPFEITVVKGSEEKSIPASGVKQVSRKASGQIVVYNAYSSAVQKLRSGTRFQSPSGKIYKIQSEITVPGLYKRGSETIPGSIEVTVYAEQAGEAYNTGLTDFTVPGFIGDPRYDKFYARSKTEIVGGFSGPAPVASEKDTTAGYLALEKSLKEDLFKEASSQVPEGYILYKDATQYSFTESTGTSPDEKVAVLKKDGVMTSVLIKKEELISSIKQEIPEKSVLPNAPFSLNNPEALAFSFTNGKPVIDSKTTSISFGLSGNLLLSYDVNKDSIAADLAGRAKTDFQAILGKYPSVYSAKISSVRPFWSTKFPASPERISVSVSIK